MAVAVSSAPPATAGTAVASQLARSRPAVAAIAGQPLGHPSTGRLCTGGSAWQLACELGGKPVRPLQVPAGGRPGPTPGTPVTASSGPLGQPQSPLGGKKENAGNKGGTRMTGVLARGVPVGAEGFFPPAHHLHKDLPPHQHPVLSDEERQARLDAALREIVAETHQREQKLRDATLASHLDSELKFGKLLLSQGQYAQALAHFDKVVRKSAPDSRRHCEATYQKAQCLDHEGRRDEAKELYESLVQYRAPHAHVKRRAAEALWRMGGTTPTDRGSTNGVRGPSSSMFDDYLREMYVTGFGSFHPKEKYVETGQEKVVMMLVPASILLMGPLLIGWLLLHH